MAQYLYPHNSSFYSNLRKRLEVGLSICRHGSTHSLNVGDRNDGQDYPNEASWLGSTNCLFRPGQIQPEPVIEDGTGSLLDCSVTLVIEG